MAACNRQYLVLNVREECDPGHLVVSGVIGLNWIVCGMSTIMAKHECAALVRDREAENERAKHVLAARRVLVSLEERSWACACSQ